MATSSLANALRRSLLIKIISKPAPSREDINSVVELTASKVVEALQAQSMTIYLVEGNDITFKHVYYSPTLWAAKPSEGDYFKELSEKLLATKLPLGTGNVGKVIASGQPLFFTKKGPDASSLLSMAKTTGFEVHSMLTAPLKANVVIGAIQVLNKEPAAGTNGEFTQRDLALLQEVAEYSATLIHRMLDPKFQLSAEDTAKFISRLTDLPLVQLVVLGYAFGGKIKNLEIGVVNEDHGLPSVKLEEMCQAVAANAKTFNTVAYTDKAQAMREVWGQMTTAAGANRISSADLNRMLPALSAYIGQVGLGSTDRYLSLTPERFRTQLDKLSPRRSKKRWRDNPALIKFLTEL